MANKRPSPTKTKVATKKKGIDEMNVLELKEALKKRRLKGWSTYNKEELVNLLKRETKQQRLISLFSPGLRRSKVREGRAEGEHQHKIENWRL